MKIHFGLFAFLLLILSCSKDDSKALGKEDFVSLFGGNSFKGTAKGVRSEDGQNTYNWDGVGRITLMEDTADSVSLVFLADFGKEGEINFKVRGTYKGPNYSWSVQDGSSYFKVEQQRIDGLFVNAEQHMTFQGTMEQEKVQTHIRVEFLENNGVFPKGSVLDLNFDTAREIIDDDGKGCQMRLVPIWGPSGMTMGMVPDC